MSEVIQTEKAEELPKFMSEDEIVEDLVRMINDSPAGLHDWLKLKKDDIISLHHGTGMAVRNRYLLWHEKNPYTVIDPEPNADGVLDHPDFPDQVSHRILERVWQRLQDEHRPVKSDVPPTDVRKLAEDIDRLE